jgi:hypothetical protein
MNHKRGWHLTGSGLFQGIIWSLCEENGGWGDLVSKLKSHLQMKVRGGSELIFHSMRQKQDSCFSLPFCSRAISCLSELKRLSIECIVNFVTL